MDGLLAVPVSGVEPDWLHLAFRPQINQAIHDIQHGGILWLRVDASAEGDYLASHVETWIKSSGRPVGELRVWQEDPLLLWEDLFGTPDRSAETWALPPGTVICLLNGSALPVRFLQERAALLAAFCRAKGWILVVPILHDAIKYLRERGTSAAEVAVPAFRDVGAQKSRILIEAMVEANFSSLAADLRASLILQLVGTDPPPVSRTELQAWIDFYREKPDLAAALRRHPAPPIPRYPALPSEPPTSLTLQSRLKVVAETFRRASDAFLGWSGRPLFRVLYEPPDPFESNDPIHWFSGNRFLLIVLAGHARSCVSPPSPVRIPAKQGYYRNRAGSGIL
jgi:hypothetical protein